ncbi:hypothetical protein ACFP2T_14805 [Plantactinospora solaniradicis]|uniref:Lipoprotein n=1 Tax=Plantactinospora solaniradicis TaxID=1723736 RepID=A0ABW1K7C7_9ACTN
MDMTTPRRAMPILVAIGLLAAGCSGPGPAGPTPTASRGAGPATSTAAPGGTATGSVPAGAAVVSCGHIIDRLDAPPADRTVLADAVAMWTEILRPRTTGDTDPARLFAKTGLVVRADSVVDLSVPAASTGRPWIGWGSPARPARQLRLPGCPGESGWVVFAGGFWLDEPACVPLTVRSGGRVERARVRIGVDCPG